jgi:hypothetical protein
MSGIDITSSATQAHLKGEFRCPNQKLNITDEALKQKLFNSDSLGNLDYSCNEHEFRMQMEMNLSISFIHPETGNDETISTEIKTFSGAEVNGQLLACRVDEVGRSYDDSCAELSIEKIKNSYDDSEEHSYEELRFQGLRYTNNTDPYYSSGEILFKVNDWTGKVIYTDGYTNPNFTAKRGDEEVSESLYDIENLEHD